MPHQPVAAWAVAISTTESQLLDQSRLGGLSSPAVAGLFCCQLGIECRTACGDFVDVSVLDASQPLQNVRSEQFLAQMV